MNTKRHHDLIISLDQIKAAVRATPTDIVTGTLVSDPFEMSGVLCDTPAPSGVYQTIRNLACELSLGHSPGVMSLARRKSHLKFARH